MDNALITKRQEYVSKLNAINDVINEKAYEYQKQLAKEAEAEIEKIKKVICSIDEIINFEATGSISYDTEPPAFKDMNAVAKQNVVEVRDGSQTIGIPIRE